MTQLKADNIFENQFELHPIVMIGDFNVADNLHNKPHSENENNRHPRTNQRR